MREALAAERTIPDRYEMPRVNVTQVLGMSVNDAIRSAEARQRAAWAHGVTSPNPSASPNAGTGALADMLRRMEQSAAQAQRPSTPRTASTAANKPTATPPKEPEAKVAATEISSTPVLEIYRRVVDDHGRSELALVDKRKV